ncbi:MAG TPA: phage tail tip lysozyme [Candidatus Saccharimonadales bacterium]|nr:phage tail tip lysozyme [Candidatus Saccharimonadales bacterium]
MYSALCIALLAVILAVQCGAPVASALSADQKKLFQEGINYYDASTCATDGNGCACSSGSTVLTGQDNEEKTWNYFKGKGLSDQQVAGIMGNLEQESHFDPEIMQIGGRSKNPADAGSEGWGLIQWSPGAKVIDLAKQAGVTGPIYELATQLDLLWQHMHNNPVVTQPFDFNHFKAITDVDEATGYFRSQIEGGTDPGGIRESNAHTILSKYGGTNGGPQVSADGSCVSTGSPDCQTATGTAKILCEAKKYDTVSYEESVRGGHQGAAEWHKSCPTIGPSCVLDCSGLVNIAVYDAFGVDLRENTFSEATDSKYWKHISFDQLQPGDLIQPAEYFPNHVEIVDHIDSNKIYSFGAHSSDHPQPDQVGEESTPWIQSSGDLYLHYVGPGAQ